MSRFAHIVDIGSNGHPPDDPPPWETGEPPPDLFEGAPDRERPHRPPRIVPQIRSAPNLVVEFPALRPFVVKSILRERETANIIAPSKRGKSWFALRLGMDVVRGAPFLGRYETSGGNVLLIDNELDPSVSASRIKAVADALHIRNQEYAGLHVENLRGRLIDIHQMVDYFKQLDRDRYKLIILDALYRFVPDGVSENDNAGMMRIYNALDQYAAHLNSAFVCIHHSSKGVQSDRSIVDVGAGAGSQARACDAHIILRDHEQEDCVVLDGVVRSFAPLDPVTLRWAFPLWEVDESLDPSKLKRQQGAREEKQERADKDRIDRIVKVLIDNPRSSVTKIGRLAGGMDPRTVCRLLGKIEESIRREPGKAGGNETELISLIE